MKFDNAALAETWEKWRFGFNVNLGIAMPFAYKHRIEIMARYYTSAPHPRAYGDTAVGQFRHTQVPVSAMLTYTYVFR